LIQVAQSRLREHTATKNREPEPQGRNLQDR
jgi:hypothetical protein